MSNNIVADAFEQAMDIMKNVKRQVANVGEPTDRMLATRYMIEHKDNPASMVEFVRQNAPKGANILTEMNRYEREMNKLAQKYGMVKDGKAR